MRDFVRHIHFVGIGGIGMSGIAEVLLDLDFRVSGSDLADSSIVDRLRKAGAEIYIGHHGKNIKGADAVVISSAVDADNSEVTAARESKVPLVPRAEMLGELMRFRKGIAIAGTHGKTTTTSLVAAVFASAELDPTLIVGGVVNSMHSNARLGQGEYLVAEADESDASFLHLQPQMAVVTNIDQDHMETYDGDFNRLKQTYLDFLHNLPFYGLAILCFDDPNVRDIASHIRKPIVSYGTTEDVDYRAVNITQKGRESSFEVIHQGELIGSFKLALPGRHNVLNAMAAISIASKLGLPTESIQQALSEFQGIGRRFQNLGETWIGDHVVEIVDDYAHHPTELAATLQASKDCWPERRILVVFQPHRFTRTRDLFDDFAQLLSGIDHLIITEIYPAGEQVISGSDGRSLCRAIRKRGNDPVFVESLEELNTVLPNLTQNGDILLTLGAGDIGRFAQSLAGKSATAPEGDVHDG
jgi:UDP-N-acetylmuramate--alanine ligase